MPLSFSALHRVGSIGDWQRGDWLPQFEFFMVTPHDEFFSSAKPSDTKNRYLSGVADEPVPVEPNTVPMAGIRVEKAVPSSLLSFCHLTVIKSILPAAVLAPPRSADRAYSDLKLADWMVPPKS